MARPLSLFIAYYRNLDRVKNLIRLYEQHPKAKGKGRKPVEASDILRAAVVLQYAIFEEICRSLEVSSLPTLGEEVLNDVPLVGLSRSGRAEKFLLGALAAHRGKKVEDLIKESVAAHMAKSSYSSIEDSCGMLKRLGVDKRRFEDLFPSLKALMERRHHIVHQCDKNLRRGAGHQRVLAISKRQVSLWNVCLRNVFHRLSTDVESGKRANQSPEPTPGSVTPRATVPKSE